MSGSQIVVGVLAIGFSSVISSWQGAAHRHHPMERPAMLVGPAALVVLLTSLALLLLGVVLFWRGIGWFAGVGAFVLGFWVLPIPLEQLWQGQYRRP
jgi:membrane associated rhomboid family serine protease